MFYSNRSAAHLSKGDGPAALADAEKCVEINPKWSKGYGRKGAALFALRRFDEAIDIYRSGLEVEPGNNALKEGLAEVEAARSRAQVPPPPGMGGMGIFGPDMYPKLMANPKFHAYLADPAFKAKLDKLANDPQGLITALQIMMPNAGMSIPGMSSAPVDRDPRLVEVLEFLIGGAVKGMGMDEEEPEEAPKAKRGPPSPLFPKQEEPVIEESPEEAAERKALEEKKKAAAAKKEEGNSFYKKKDFDNALRCYDEAAEIDPSDLTFKLNKAAVYFEQSKFEECKTYCKEIIEEARSIQAPFSIIAKAYGRIGNVCYKLNDLEGAIDAYDSSLLEQRTDDIAKRLKKVKAELQKAREQAYIDPEKGLIAKEEGNTLFRSGNFVGALEKYSEAIKRDPTNAVYWNNSASAKAKLMDFSGALADCEKALELDPKYVRALCRKGNCNLALKEYHKAMDVFKKALDLDPDNAEAKDGLSRTMVKIRETMSSTGDEAEEIERRNRAMADPEIQAIIRDPMVNAALEGRLNHCLNHIS